MSKLVEELEKCSIVVAILGQPNVGKSTLFNRLTGEVARVGNFPGTTVELMIGRRVVDGATVCFVDLPGVYGLSTSSTEERIARNFIVEGRADVYLVLVDATLPERTMYLALQVLELVPNVVIALTKWDLAHKRGVHIHVDKLAARLGVPVVPISGITGEGVRELLEAIVDVARRRKRSEVLRIDYGVLETYVRELEELLKNVEIPKNVPLRWVAIRLLEGDEELVEMLRSRGREDLLAKIESVRMEIKKLFGRDPEELIINARFRYIEDLLKEVVVRVELPLAEQREPLIDRVLRRPLLGGLTSITILFLVFLTIFVINTGFPLNILLDVVGMHEAAEALERYSLSGVIESLFDALSSYVRGALEETNPVLASLLADGVIPGVGAVLSFFPLVLLVSVALSILEDTGLGPRMATALHGAFEKFGLSGRAVYPLLIAFGCNVPAVLASRTAIDDAERLEIALAVPFVPCQARLIVLLYFVTHLLRNNPVAQSITVLSVYLGGVVLYLASSKLFRWIIFKQREPPELVLEIPPIHRPSLRVVWWNSWDLAKHFLKKAGTIIFALSIATWFLLSYGPSGWVEDPSQSYAAELGRVLAPILEAMYGLNSEAAWRVGFALISGFVAKEGLVASMAQMSGIEENNVFEVLGLSLAQGLALMVVMMYYVPCLATLAAIYSETKSIKLTLFSILYLVAVSVALSLVVYAIAIVVGLT